MCYKKNLLLAFLCVLSCFSITLAQSPLKLSTGELIIVTEDDGAYEQGTILKTGPSGTVKLYDLDDYAADFGETIVEGKDGYLYAARLFGGGLVRFKLDGSSKEYIKALTGDPNPHIERLTSTDKGVFGALPGSTKDHGYIVGVTYDKNYIETFYDFTGNGEKPFGKLVEGRDDFLYGTTRFGGAHNLGVIFKLDQNGQNYASLLDFDGSNGKKPLGILLQDANGNLYGTTLKGGKKDKGIVFRVSEDGQNFQKLLDYHDIGVTPTDDLRFSDDGSLYSNRGLFKMNTDGTGLTRLSAPIPVTGDFVPDVHVMNPQDQITNLPTNLILQAKPFGDATQYHFEVSESPEFNDGVISLSNTEPKVGLKKLKHNTQYYTRVRINISDSFGAVTSFTTGPPQILPDVFVSNPPDQLTNVNIHAFLKVKPVAGATDYIVELSETPNFTNEIQSLHTDVLSPPTVTRTDLKYGTTYYARVKSDVSPGYGKTTSFSTKTAVGATTLLFPGNEATGVPIDPLRITINKVEGATQYTLQLSSSPNFVSYEITAEKSSTFDGQRTFTFENTVYSGFTYYARAKTDLSPSWGPTSTFTTKEFTTIDPPDGAIDLPIDGLVISLSPANNYAYVYVTESAGGPTLSFYTYNNTVTLNGLKYATKYDILVVTYGQHYGQARSSFTTMDAPLTTSILQENALAYPNPSSNSFTLSKSSDEIISITVTDGTGTVLYQQRNIGLEEIQFGGELGKGNYILKVTTRSGTKVQRLVKN